VAWARMVPINFLPIEALRVPPLRRYQIRCPTGSGPLTDLEASHGSRSASHHFVTQEGRVRPCHGSFARYAADPHWRDYILFYEYFDGDTGRGLGASHQTVWTALVAPLFDYCGPRRGAREETSKDSSREGAPPPLHEP
jgi:hypothetical protein